MRTGRTFIRTGTAIDKECLLHKVQTWEYIVLINTEAYLDVLEDLEQSQDSESPEDSDAREALGGHVEHLNKSSRLSTTLKLVMHSAC